MADEPTLPRLAFDENTLPFTNNISRKRVRLSSPPISSDPAIFSSDDDPSADNYTKERSKRKFRGPWFRQVPAMDSGSHDQQGGEAQGRSKRRFERQFDSGVFLGSDGTDMDEGEDGMPAFNEAALPLRQPRHIHVKTANPSSEELAQNQIQKCLEDGDEIIDLSSRGLRALSNATIRPLATFTRVPPVAQDVFYRLEPELKIFLSSNYLKTLPEELFYLGHVTALSLRGNVLQELPSHIGNLQNLRELNISLNALRYLPYEILDLYSESGHIKSIQIHPNPFYQPQFPSEEEPNEEDVESITYKIGLGGRRSTKAKTRRSMTSRVLPDTNRTWHPRWKASFQARSDIRYLDNYGNLVKGPIFPEHLNKDEQTYDRIPIADVRLEPEPPVPRGSIISRAPSLVEVALRACARTPQFSQLASLLPDDCPQYLLDLLSKAAVQKESGSSQCTICKRKFMLQRTEWIEWWEIARVTETKSMASAASPLRQMENERDGLESLVPLIRRGCSWLCVPEKMEVVGDAEEMDAF